MKEYPSIGREIRDDKIYAFDKLDGSSVRAEWNKKNKFWKFGSRTQLIDNKNELYGESVDLIIEKYEQNLHDIFVKNRFEKVICFFEFWGKHSFAGVHQKEEHTVTLFDISVHKKGIILPNDYLKLVGHLDIAKMLYFGNANSIFEEQVRSSQLKEMTFEGVVCKAIRYLTPGVPVMFKIKSRKWVEKLGAQCQGDKKLFESLV